jgi:hypothetical protein
MNGNTHMVPFGTMERYSLMPNALTGLDHPGGPLDGAAFRAIDCSESIRCRTAFRSGNGRYEATRVQRRRRVPLLDGHKLP